MTEITMPEPVAKAIQRSEWGTTLAFIGNGKPHPPTGTLLITTEQAEAYAAAKVREALEEVIQSLETESATAREHKAYAAVLALMSQAELIRVSIGKQ